jgi:hypothetical protein
MIKFREKQYASELSVNATKAAGIGSGVGIALNKIGNKVLPVIKKTARVDRNGNSVFNDRGEQIFNTEVISTASDRLGDILGNARSKIDIGLSKIGTIGEYLKGANRLFFEKLGKIGKWILDNPTKASIIGALVGASLAVGYYLIKRSYNGVSNKLSNFRGKMIDLVVNDLKKLGYRRDTDFTTDPAQADYLKTKVCIVVSSTKDDLSLVINSINDPKLDSVSKSIIKTLPSSAKYNRKESDKNNELSLTLMSSNGDHAYISSITEMFIKRKYPVFLIEIN